MRWLEFINDKGARILLPVEVVAAVIHESQGALITIRGGAEYYVAPKRPRRWWRLWMRPRAVRTRRM